MFSLAPTNCNGHIHNINYDKGIVGNCVSFYNNIKKCIWGKGSEFVVSEKVEM